MSGEEKQETQEPVRVCWPLFSSFLFLCFIYRVFFYLLCCWLQVARQRKLLAPKQRALTRVALVETASTVRTVSLRLCLVVFRMFSFSLQGAVGRISRPRTGEQHWRKCRNVSVKCQKENAFPWPRLGSFDVVNIVVVVHRTFLVGWLVG